MGKHIGNFLRDLREKRGLSQSDVARMLSLKTAQSISNIERGVSPLPRTKIKKFADALGVRKDELVSALMHEMQDRVAKAAGVKARAIVVGNDLSGEEFALVSGLVDRLRMAKTSERAAIRKTVRKLLG